MPGIWTTAPNETNPAIQNIYKAKTCAKERPGHALVASGDQRPFYHRVHEDQQQGAVALCRFHALHKGVQELLNLRRAPREKAQAGDEAAPDGLGEVAQRQQHSQQSTEASAASLPPTARTPASLGPT